MNVGFQPGDRVVVTDDRIWPGVGPGGTITSNFYAGATGAGTPPGSLGGAYHIRLDGYAYQSDGDYHTVACQVIEKEDASPSDDEVDDAMNSILQVLRRG